jgi:DNA-binding IclR family transcriptional regulator
LIVAHNRRPMKITDIADQAGISPSKAHRCLVSFIRGGFIQQDDETGLYSMGPVTLEFSLSCLATIEPISLASREAENLCVETGQTVAVAVWGSLGPTVVRWEQPARPLMVNAGLGSVFPLYRSATGRVFAAFMPPEVIRTYLHTIGESEQQARTETIERVRKRGVARAEGDFMEGMSAFAAPVFDDRGRLVLTMTALGYKASFDHCWNGAVVTALRAAAERVSLALGYRHERLIKG